MLLTGSYPVSSMEISARPRFITISWLVKARRSIHSRMCVYLPWRSVRHRTWSPNLLDVNKPCKDIKTRQSIHRQTQRWAALISLHSLQSSPETVMRTLSESSTPLLLLPYPLPPSNTHKHKHKHTDTHTHRHWTNQCPPPCQGLIQTQSRSVCCQPRLQSDYW